MKKRKGRHSKAPLSRLEMSHSIANIHLRLCHRCFCLNESSKPILKCIQCERSFLITPSELKADDELRASIEDDPVEQALEDFETDSKPVDAKDLDDELDDDEEEAESNKKKAMALSGLSVRW